MSTRPKLTRRTTDRYLDRSSDVTAHPVSALLDAAGASSGVGELPGEATAVAQFRAGAHLAGPMTGTSRLRKLIAAPAAAVTAVALVAAGGGLALAASYGKIDVPFVGHDNRSDSAPNAPSATNPGLGHTSGPHATSGPQGPKSGHSTGSSSTNAPSGSPTPSFQGLCRAYQAGAYDESKKSPAFKALITRAGGADKVSAFCVDLIGPPKVAPTHKPKPTQAGVPKSGASPTKAPKPTQAATPTSKAKPTQAATPTKGKASKTPKS